MNAADIPAKFGIYWAASASSSYVRPIPNTVQQPTFPYAASAPTGFPALTFVPTGAGGEGPDGRDMNGILQQITAWIQWQNAGGAINYDATFQGQIGGYPIGALVGSLTTPGFIWRSTADSNTTNPDTGGAGWVANGVYSWNSRVGIVTLLAADIDTALGYVPVNPTAIRIRLAAPLNLYVSTTGSDSNNGLAVGTPFLTRQHAWNVLAGSYDLNGFNVTINLANGTYTDSLNATAPLVGQGSATVTWKGNTGTPSLVVTNTAGVADWSASGGASFTLQGMTIGGASTTLGVYAVNSGQITIGSSVVFGPANVAHIQAQAGIVSASGAYTISGSAAAHYSGYIGGLIALGTLAVTLSGTPHFVTFAQAVGNSTIAAGAGFTFSGSAVGARYAATLNGVIITGGGGANFFPGNSAGSTGSGGQYA